MIAIKSKDTKPEMIVRRLVHKLGFRYRLHRKDLPGKPDLVFPKLKKIIFVNGCYWHMHKCKYGKVTPKTNAEFWKNKREATVRRDKNNKNKLSKLGWGITTIWECQTRNHKRLRETIIRFLSK